MSNNALTESFNSGFGALSNAWNVPAVANGQVSLTGNSAMMEWAIGRDAGHGYGTYTVTAKAEGSQPGPGIILWPGDDKWPGQEIDMLEITPDGSGRQYGTVHWNNNGADAYATVIYDGVQGGSFHEYQMIWAPGLITFKVDGVTKGTIDGNVPVDYDHGGMNNTIGFMNNNPNTSLTISHLEFTPLGQSVVATPAPAQQAPAPSAPAPSAPAAAPAAVAADAGPVDWNALAAQVTAHYEATGRWELPGAASAAPAAAPAPAPAPQVEVAVKVDWEALAAQVTANYEATGHWYL
ncbi:glycoside hydrolase family 16 protein [Paeniroseomonas aquatica]|uniref:Glycoside hydrolase family 16 protein n=1 Tax=Paeniroseomonas aquatica TaxID=373043 RepID=A0ABT8A4L3_9PROT|nr:glycoside hydrolase family 16 protein [Paeniroseomonas aquatica]MDN3564649.1 glycoside hydrolase family 16 protein [Paeniroseomonas aquatica]